MRNTPQSITAKTEFASASFRRTSPTDVMILLEYDAPEQRVEHEGNEPAAIAALCESEISFTRQSLMDVGEALAELLHDVGARPTINREWSDRDERTFRWQDNVVTVEKSSYTSEEAISVPVNASEAAIVRAVVASMLEQRTRGIRNVYRTALRELPKGH